MANAIDKLLESAQNSPKHIVLSEGADPRIQAAAIRAQELGIAQITLLGGGPIGDGVTVIDPKTADIRAELAALLVDLRGHKGMTAEKAEAALDDPLIFAAAMVRAGLADGTVGGAVHATGDVVRAALQIIGKSPATSLVSSFFLMLLDPTRHGDNATLLFADCGLNVAPDAAELAAIAGDSAASFAALTGGEPRIAMLSFSTYNSASHPDVDKMQEATRLAKAAYPTLLIDGELQFDAAFVPNVAATKAKGSPLNGLANIFIFPDLNAGNIGYKIAQRIGGAAAIGPVLQGLNHPANDLSRGCSTEDVLHMIAVTVAQANQHHLTRG